MHDHGTQRGWVCFAREASPLDAVSLAPRLRPEDRAEIDAHTGHDPLSALLEGYRYSDFTLAICASSTGEVVALCGVAEIPWTDGLVAAPWLLASPDIRAIQKTFLRCSLGIVTLMQRRYQVLCNFVDARNTLHIHWLKWCGFKFLKRHDRFGAKGLPFYEFVRIEPCAN